MSKAEAIPSDRVKMQVKRFVDGTKVASKQIKREFKLRN